MTIQVNKRMEKVSKIKRKNRVSYTKKNKYNHEEDKDLSFTDFFEKNISIIKSIAFQHSRLLPLHLQTSMRDDLESEAALLAFNSDKKWDGDKGRTRRSWMIFCLHTNLVSLRGRMIKKYGHVFQYGDVENIKDKSRIIEADYEMKLLVSLFSERLREDDKILFMGNSLKMTSEYLAKLLKRRKKDVLIRMKELREEFLEFAKRSKGA